MRKRIALVALIALLLCVLVPTPSFTEDGDTILLARAIYALAKGESYETKLALGSLVINRLENGWFADSLGGVLRDQQQFPAGERYDADSLRAAHAVISGRRTLGREALYYQAADASAAWGAANLVASVGNYNFYSVSGNV